MKCPYCGGDAKWCPNREIYGRNYGKSYMCYYCKPCNAYVGCHNNTRKPLGTLANDELRSWRKKVHAKIDPLWKKHGWNRGSIYGKLKRHFGKNIHIGESDIDLCKEIINNYQKIFFNNKIYEKSRKNNGGESCEIGSQRYKTSQ